MPIPPTGNTATNPIIRRPLRARVLHLPHGIWRPVTLAEFDSIAILEIHPGTPDTEVLRHTIDMLFADHPLLLRQWIDGWSFEHVPLDVFAVQWPNLTADIRGIVASSDAIPIRFRM